MKSNLTPEKRFDKNGRTVTRWVKPHAASSSAKGSLPAPTAAKPLKTPHLDEAFKRANLDVRGITISDLDPRTTQAVEALIESANDGGTVSVRIGVDQAVFYALKEVRDDYSENVDYSHINNVGVFGEALASSTTTIDSMNMYINGVHTNGFYTDIHDFLLEASEQEREGAKALVKFANSVPEPWSYTYYGYDESDSEDSPEDHADATEDDYCIRIGGNDAQRLSQFVIDHHDQVDDIIAIVKERGDADVDMLEGIIGHNAQSLRQGLL